MRRREQKPRVELLEERLAKEGAIKQNEIFEESFKNTERASKDKKNMQQIAFKKLDVDNDQKAQAINDLKTKMKEVEIQSMKNENALRDELEQHKDKNNQLIQNEAMIEIYNNRLEEIPEQTPRTNCRPSKPNSDKKRIKVVKYL